MTGSQRYLVVRNEKASRNYTSEFVRELFCEESKGAFTTRVNILGHTQQGGNPSPFDRIMGSKMGGKAVDHLIDQINEQIHVSKSMISCTGPNTATLLGVIVSLFQSIGSFVRLGHSLQLFVRSVCNNTVFCVLFDYCRK